MSDMLGREIDDRQNVSAPEMNGCHLLQHGVAPDGDGGDGEGDDPRHRPRHHFEAHVVV